MNQHTQTESIDKYMRNINCYKLITVEEENRLADLIMHGSPEEARQAREQLACANLRLVVKIAHDFKHFGLGFADLVQEGNLGLMIAVDKFDPSKGAKFSCYAAWWIKQSMRKALVWQSRTIRIPGGSAQRLIHVDKARARLAMEFGREPTAEEVAEATGFSVQQIENLDHAVTEVLSMDTQVSDDSTTTFDQMLSESLEDNSENKRKAVDAVDAVLEKLSQLDRAIVSRLFGMDGDAVEPKQVAQETGLSVEAIQARLEKVLSFMREELNALGVGPIWCN